MQNFVTYLSMFLTVLVMQGQNVGNLNRDADASSKYDIGMMQAFKLWGEEKSWDAANMFERISKAEPTDWLPLYYVAEINIINSFGERDKTKLSSQLEKAQDYINQAKTISPDNPELMVLQALLYTAWIVYDGKEYGMLYSPKATELYKKALALDPENPRMIMANAEWNIGSAKYFGQPIEPYCKDIERAIKLSADYKPKGKFYPKFLAERAKQVLKANCE